MIDNAYSIEEYAPDFAKIYMKEKELLLGFLKEGDSVLWHLAKSIVDEYYNE
jgi:hypothetical protein